MISKTFLAFIGFEDCWSHGVASNLPRFCPLSFILSPLTFLLHSVFWFLNWFCYWLWFSLKLKNIPPTISKHLKTFFPFSGLRSSMVRLLSYTARVLHEICHFRISTTADRPECSGNTIIRKSQHSASYKLKYQGKALSTLKSNLSL